MLLACIFEGKILDDKLKIKDYDIEPNKNFIVVMVTKVRGTARVYEGLFMDSF